MKCLGHLGQGLTPVRTGGNAFKMICRPDPEMAQTVPTASVSSDLIGAWLKAPSQSCPLNRPAHYSPGGRDVGSHRSRK